MNTLMVWLNAHPALAAGVIWPLFTMLVNLGFDFLKAHESTSAVVRAVDAALSAAGLDAGKLVAAVKSLFAPPPPPAGPKASKPFDPDMTPTEPERVALKRMTLAMLAAGMVLVVALTACAAARDALKWGADDAECVYQKTDQGQTVEKALLSCGIENTPDALKFFADLVTQRAAARRAAACEPSSADWDAAWKDAGSP